MISGGTKGMVVLNAEKYGLWIVGRWAHICIKNWTGPVFGSAATCGGHADLWTRVCGKAGKRKPGSVVCPSKTSQPGLSTRFCVAIGPWRMAFSAYAM